MKLMFLKSLLQDLQAMHGVNAVEAVLETIKDEFFSEACLMINRNIEDGQTSMTITIEVEVVDDISPKPEITIQ